MEPVPGTGGDKSFAVLGQNKRFLITMTVGSITGTAVGGLLLLGVVPRLVLIALPVLLLILAAEPFGKARTGTIRRKLIHVPARIATSARRIRLHLPGS